MIWLVILSFGLAAGTLGGIVGFGGSTILMPILALAFGPKEAVPIMAIAGVLANLSRVAVWWRDVDWRAAAIYCLTGIPFAPRLAQFWRSTRASSNSCLAVLPTMIPSAGGCSGTVLRQALMALAGAGVGYCQDWFRVTGPLNTPSSGLRLVKGFVSTEALGR